FIDIETLINEGLLKKIDCDTLCNPDSVGDIDYKKLYKTRFILLKKAYNNSNLENDIAFNSFCENNFYWLEDYAFFMALKDYFNGISFLEWEDGIKHREQFAMDKYGILLKNEIQFYKFIQYKFFEQWKKLKKYANKNKIKIIGDIPIYVALDSAETWSHPTMFMLDKDLKPLKVAGCPPDDFCKTGQLWGNPVYNWKVHSMTGYNWWSRRILDAIVMYDIVRIDHFRGFAEYYSIPAKDKTAENGEWLDGPGIELFKTIKSKYGKTNIIAEDLGFLTQSVTTMLKKTGFPGMKVLQFAFYENSTSEHLPYNYTNNYICYTGTHDNQTTVGWLSKLKPADKRFLRNYLNKSGKISCYDIISLALSSVAKLAIIPMQDYLELDDEARINTPSTIGNNWKWRITKEQFSEELVLKIGDLTKLYGRQ
ncbi:MAG: 4-alpha-glucanotransferase, partial [Oscillospiraceae bacterium]